MGGKRDKRFCCEGKVGGKSDFSSEELFLGWTNADGVVRGVLCMFFLFYFGCLHKCEIHVLVYVIFLSIVFRFAIRAQ
jgi:hypothetical protein